MTVAKNTDGTTAILAAIFVEKNIFQLGKGYTFHLYECPECTYLELHDFTPQ